MSGPRIIESLKHKCFLEELLFWTIKYEFPQKMVTFLLNMLPDQDYKVRVSADLNVSLTPCTMTVSSNSLL